MRLTQIGFALGMIVLAGMAFVHAAAEVSPRGLGLAVETPTTLSASALSARVDLLSRATLGQDETSGVLTASTLPADLLADARTAFSRDPLEITNARVLVLGGEFSGDEDRFAVMQQAVVLSKRDSIALVWLSQEYAQVEDIDGLLRNVDALLRTDRGAREQSVGTLVGVLASPDGDALLGDLIRVGPEWEPDFWNAFARSPVAVEYGPRFFRQSGLNFTRMEPRLRNIYVQGLINADAVASVIEIIRISPDLRADISDLAAGEFRAGAGDNPLDWRTASSGNFVSRVVPSNGRLEVDARPGSFGQAASRIVEFAGTSEIAIALAEPVASQAQLTLTARCVDGESRILGAIVLGPGQSSASTRIAPGACGFGLLTLTFRVNEGRDGEIFEITSISLR